MTEILESTDLFINIAYLVSSILFILGLKMLSSAKTARQGNLLSAIAMMVAVVAALINKDVIDYKYILIGIAIGLFIGIIIAKKVQMTDMPQMVAVFDIFGGLAAALVALAEYQYIRVTPELLHTSNILVISTIGLAVLMGMITSTGSLIAFSKLQGIMKSTPILFKGQHFINAIILFSAIILIVFLVFNPPMWTYIVILFALAAVLGILAIIPIGGADMPVVISFLNACSGLAACATGFAISNTILIVSGALVGAAGLILTQLMCKAMNRSLVNVFFAGVGANEGALSGEVETRTVTKYTPEDVVMILENARSVVMIPGYGLAASQAQHTLHELTKLLTSKGIQVRYAIHPVAGRMPGHMNVLLAEANVSYDMLWDMDVINEDFQNTDVAIVIGANDIVNPAARYKKDSVLYGMPILNADHARNVIIFKRSLGAGFAGESNELFYDPKTLMVFGDAKKSLAEISNLLKSN